MARSMIEIRTSLEERVRAAGLLLQHCARITERECAAMEAGYFEPPTDDDPYRRIVLFRQHSAVPGDALEEVLILAHEFGHFRSFEAGERTPAYEAANRQKGQWAQLPRADQQLILDEESRAWHYGRRELSELGFTDWGAFDAEAVAALDRYRERLPRLP